MTPMVPGEATRQDLYNKSVYRSLNANVSMGSGTTFDGAGNATVFTQDNTDGVMIRVGPGLTNVWGAANTDTTIVHNLGRIPIGYYVTRKYQASDTYDAGTSAGWTDKNIVLRNTIGAAADTVIYIF